MTFRWHASALFAVFLLGSSQVAMAQGARFCPRPASPDRSQDPKGTHRPGDAALLGGDYAGLSTTIARPISCGSCRR